MLPLCSVVWGGEQLVLVLNRSVCIEMLVFENIWILIDACAKIKRFSKYVKANGAQMLYV